jgi:hypothetical protein
MEDPVAEAILNQYFRRLEQALSGLAVDRRTQIVEDLRAHVEESLAAETDRSDATVLSILDRLGDPEEIAQEALADEATEVATGVQSNATHGPARRGGRVVPKRLRLAAPLLVALAVAVVVVFSLTGGPSSAAPNARSKTPVNARIHMLSPRLPGAVGDGWLPASDVSGDHQSPGASDCAPQTTSGSESAATLEADATEVASGTTAGHSWSVWSKNGESGATGLEDGGVVVDGVAYGMCPGFPNPSETELLEPSGGGDGLAYGVVGYAGTAKVAIYQGTVETFDSGQLLATTTAQTVNGVGFYITPLSQSACGVSSLEINVASQSDASEHNLGFTDNDCSNGQLVPISWSQGIWGLPPSGFPNKFQTGNGGGGDALLSPAGSTATSYDSHKVASVLASRYRILKTNRVRASTLPGHLGVTMLSRVGPRLGLDTSDVAEVKPVAGVTMWLIPGTRGVCVFEFQEGGGSGSCSSISTGLESGGMAFNAAGATTEGFAPNGVTTVTVSLANGRKLSVPVKDNAYFVRVRGTRITGVRRS